MVLNLNGKCVIEDRGKYYGIVSSCLIDKECCNIGKCVCNTNTTVTRAQYFRTMLRRSNNGIVYQP